MLLFECRAGAVCAPGGPAGAKGLLLFLMAEQVQYAPGILCRCSTTMFAPFCLWLFFAPFVFEGKKMKATMYQTSDWFIFWGGGGPVLVQELWAIQPSSPLQNFQF